MSYSSKVKKIEKLEKGVYFIRNYDIGLYFVIKLLECIGTVIFFPFILIFNIFFGRKK